MCHGKWAKWQTDETPELKLSKSSVKPPWSSCIHASSPVLDRSSFLRGRRWLSGGAAHLQEVQPQPVGAALWRGRPPSLSAAAAPLLSRPRPSSSWRSPEETREICFPMLQKHVAPCINTANPVVRSAILYTKKLPYKRDTPYVRDILLSIH